MADILLLENRVRNTIRLGESHFREFKSAYQGSPGNQRKGDPKVLCGYIGKALVAFANADGGELLIGVDDDGTITGVPHDESVIRSFLQAPETYVHPGANLPLIEATKLILDGCTVLFFSVSKGTTEIYQLPNGRCVRRKDKSTIPAAFREIQFERREVVSREYDQQFVDAATTADLDLNLLQPVADKYLSGLSPGALLSTLSISELENLQGAHESRNSFIAKVLRENEYIRELGEGMRKIFQSMEESELKRPRLYSNALWFSVGLPGKSV